MESGCPPLQRGGGPPLVCRGRGAPAHGAALEEDGVDAAVVETLQRRLRPPVRQVDPLVLEVMIALVLIEDALAYWHLGQTRRVVAAEQVGERVHGAPLHTVANEHDVAAAKQAPRCACRVQPEATPLPHSRRPLIHALWRKASVSQVPETPALGRRRCRPVRRDVETCAGHLHRRGGSPAAPQRRVAGQSSLAPTPPATPSARLGVVGIPHTRARREESHTPRGIPPVRPIAPSHSGVWDLRPAVGV